MSATTSRLHSLGSSSLSVVGHGAKWLFTDTRPPVRRVQVTIDKPRQPVVWLPTRILGNFILGSGALVATVATVMSVSLVMDVSRDHPELSEVARRYIGIRLDQWETAHGFGCITWQTNIGDDRTVNHSGGPACTPPAGQLPPPASAGDAP